MIPEKPCISPGAYIAEESVIVGDVTVGNESSVFYYSVLRGDHAQIRVGSGTNIQEHCTIHVDEDYPAVIGDGVTVGHHCIIHGLSLIHIL